MDFFYGRGLGVLLLVLATAGCHMPRPGEARPQPIPVCESQRIGEIEARFEQASSAERELLSYCRSAQSAQALSATQEHVDYMADLQFLSILLSTLSVLVILAAP